jgi:hypothetical protein
MQTESKVYSDPSTLGNPDLHSTTQVPVVATETRKVALESEDGAYNATGEIVSSQTISSKTRTVETITVLIYHNYTKLNLDIKCCLYFQKYIFHTTKYMKVVCGMNQ